MSKVTISSTIKQKILEMLIEDPKYILLIKDKYITEDMWGFVIEKEPDLFKEIKMPSIEMCLIALESDGSLLSYIKKKCRHIHITRKMVYTAIPSCPSIILEVPSDVIDEGLKEYAFDHQPELMVKFDYVRPAYINKKIQENPSFIKHIINPTDKMICDAIRMDPNVSLYFPVLSTKAKELIREVYPGLVDFHPAFKKY